MKKLLSLCIMLSMLLCALPSMTVSAAGAAVKAGDVSCASGETVSVPITIENNTGFANMGITVQYDNTALTLKSSTPGSTGAIFTPAQSTAVNPYNMSWDGTSNITFNGTLVTLEFDVAPTATGTYPIIVSYYKGRNGDYTDGMDVNYDEDFKPLNLSYHNGSVTVSGGSTVTPPVEEPDPSGMFVRTKSVSGSKGNIVQVPVILGNNTGFANLGIEINYDQTALTLKSASGSSDVGAIFTPAQSTAVYPYNMGWDGVSNINFEGTIATLEFEISESAKAGNYPITVSYYKGRNGDYADGMDVNYDENFKPLNLQYISGYITVLDGSSSDSIAVTDFSNANGITFKTKLTSAVGVSGDVVAAVYDASGALVSVQVQVASNELDFAFGNMSDADLIKVMWWDSLSGLKPRAKAKTININ